MSIPGSAKANAATPVSAYVQELDIALLPIESVLDRLNSNAGGLTAAQARERLLKHGANTINITVPVPIWALVRENFFHTMAVLLWFAGCVGFAARMPQLGIAIWLVNIINGSFSLWQEYHAERATEALKRLLPSIVQVRRDGIECSISALDLVPGDVILLKEGDKICADARLISEDGLSVDQSTLTGESRPRRKAAPPAAANHRGEMACARAELRNLVFAGTSVIAGHALAVVYATGTSTEFGRIARLTQTIVDQPSPLQREMVRATRIVSLLSVSIGALVFAAATIVTHVTPEQAFVLAMGMIVAFVPEGMVPTVTLALALAVQRMARQKALVKRLSSVEALGCTNVICTDKTGTLTQNRMTVVHACAGRVDYAFTGLISDGASAPVKTSLPPDLAELLRAGVLCNNARLKGDGGCAANGGDPTEVAILVAAAERGQSRLDAETAFPRVKEHPFDSRRKCMSTVHDDGLARLAYIKGSPATVLERSLSLLADGKTRPIDEGDRRELTRIIDGYARQGLRVIAAARRELSDDDSTEEDRVEQGLTFLGLFAMYDPPHPEVPASIKQCREAGIQVVMITGDYEVTAEAIARNVGILGETSARVITGRQLDRMSDQELVELLSGDIVFARVNPEHKLRVVQAFQRCGKIVAVTGDGVNDAPALKTADIGVAMGVAGTDVAKESADMILLDDNFTSIVNAVREGRAVYDNIKKFAVYVFNSNMAEAVPFAVMILSCGFVPMPLTVMQVLAIDLGTDMVPAIGLGADPPEAGIMKRHPRSRSQPLLSRALLAEALLWYGLIEAIAAMSGYFYMNLKHGWPFLPLAPIGSHTWAAATTMTLACIVTAQVGAVFCCRSERLSVFSMNPMENRLVVAGVLFELTLLAGLIYTPLLQATFNTAPLHLVDLAFACLWIPIIICLDEMRKFILRKVASAEGGEA